MHTDPALPQAAAACGALAAKVRPNLPRGFMLLCLLAGLQAQAGTTGTPSKPNPADPGAPIDTQRAPSALKDYKPFADPSTPPDWRAANRRVLEAGGWRAYAKEAAAASAAPAASAPSASSTPAPRQSHHHHHGGHP